MRIFLVAILLIGFASFLHAEDPPVFSGPQVDERLPRLTVRSLLPGEDNKDIDVFKESGRKPIVILFVHQVTRPAIAVVRTLSEYCKSLDGKVHFAIVFLTDDIIKTRQWADAARQSLPKDVILGVAPDGLEGPGSYGLNRNVILTAIVGKGEKVTASFALIQPSDTVDAPKIARAIADAAGVQPPTAVQLARSDPMSRMPGGVNDAEVRSLLVPVIQKASSKEQIDAAALKIETKAKEDAAFQKNIGDRCRRIVSGGALENYGNEFGQAYLKKWSESFK